MLIEIHCDKFNETPIRFKEGLNIVTGDSAATNSIGKSTCLMVVDFVFGGNTLVEHNRDVISELGHHKYCYKILMNGRQGAFCRDTGNPDFVFQCNADYVPEKTLTITEYRSILGHIYTDQIARLSFRHIASLFSRIWGKDNLDPKRPLDAHIKASPKEAISFILNLYQRYDFIAPLEESLERDTEQKNALTSAKRQKIIPEISTKKYKDNQRLAVEIDAEFSSIKDELYKYAANIRMITSREVAGIKEAKDTFIQARSDVSARLQRIDKSLANSSYIKSKAFASIKEYFPEVNVQKIEEVENFHNNISRILKEELKTARTLLAANLNQIDDELRALDVKLEVILKNIDNPSIIVDHVYGLSKTREMLRLENSFHEKSIQLTAIVKDQKLKLDDEKNRQLATVAQGINEALASLSDRIYGVGRKSPYLTAVQL